MMNCGHGYFTRAHGCSSQFASGALMAPITLNLLAEGVQGPTVYLLAASRPIELSLQLSLNHGTCELSVSCRVFRLGWHTICT